MNASPSVASVTKPVTEETRSSGSKTPIDAAQAPQNKKEQPTILSMHAPRSTLYKLELAWSLPLIDLSRNIARPIIGKDRNEVFLGIMRIHYGILGAMYRLGGVLFWITIFVSAPVGCILSIIGGLLMVPAMICSYSMMSLDMLKHLCRQQEVLFIMLNNACNFTILAIVFSDIRSIGAVMSFATSLIPVLSDALFRTVKSTFKSIGVAIPVMFSTGVMVYLRKIDTDRANYREFKIGNVKIQLSDILFNTTLTAVVFLLRILYRRRHTFQEATSGLITCVVYRGKLVLNPMRDTPQTRKMLGRRRSSLLDKQTQTARSLIYSSNCNAAMPHVQQLQLVPLQLTSIDAAETIGIKIPDKKLAVHWRVLHAICAATGLVLSVTTMFLPAQTTIVKKVDSQAWSLAHARGLHAIPVLGCICTIVAVVPFMLSYQRQLLRILFRNFDVVFIVCQFLTATVTLSDMLGFDYRSFAAFAWSIWYIWIVLLDAIPPNVRRYYGLMKRYASAVIFALFFCMAYVLYTMFLKTNVNFVDNLIFEWQLDDNLHVEMHTQSFFMNRLMPIAIWNIRLLWEMLMVQEQELIFIKGMLEYYCPLEMYPIPKVPKTVRPTSDNTAGSAASTEANGTIVNAATTE